MRDLRGKVSKYLTCHSTRRLWGTLVYVRAETWYGRLVLTALITLNMNANPPTNINDASDRQRSPVAPAPRDQCLGTTRPGNSSNFPTCTVYSIVFCIPSMLFRNPQGTCREGGQEPNPPCPPVRYTRNTSAGAISEAHASSHWVPKCVELVDWTELD